LSRSCMNVNIVKSKYFFFFFFVFFFLSLASSGKQEIDL